MSYYYINLLTGNVSAGPGNLFGRPGNGLVLDTVAHRATICASFIVIRFIFHFHQFGFPGLSGNFNTFMARFPD